MEKLILTVLTNNDYGLTFFRSLGYFEDDTSPDAREGTGYVIYSKLFSTNKESENSA